MTLIRQAKIHESHILSDISVKSKEYWNYPKQYFEIWKNELTITSEYIKDNDVFVSEKAGKIIGYYSIVELKNSIKISDIPIDKGLWLDHMFIVPKYIGLGFGKKMFNHLIERCEERRIVKLSILTDPNSKGFYEKMGCKYIREYSSTIEDRTTPLVEMKFR